MLPLVLLLALAACGGDSGDEEARGPARAGSGVGTFRLPGELHAKQERIADELTRQGGGHSWAGSYYEGDGLGHNLSLLVAPESGFVFVLSGCLGIYSLGEGTVEVDRDEIVLKAQNQSGAWYRLPMRLSATTCGGKRFLVPQGKLDAFRRLCETWETERFSSLYLLRQE